MKYKSITKSFYLIILIIFLSFITILLCTQKKDSNINENKDTKISKHEYATPEKQGIKPSINLPGDTNIDNSKRDIVIPKLPDLENAKKTLIAWLNTKINSNWEIYVKLIEPDFFTEKYGDLTSGMDEHISKMKKFEENLLIKDYKIVSHKKLSDNEYRFSIKLSKKDREEEENLDISVVKIDKSWYISKLSF